MKRSQHMKTDYSLTSSSVSLKALTECLLLVMIIVIFTILLHSVLTNIIYNSTETASVLIFVLMQ